MNNKIPYTEPKFNEPSFNCPHCNSFAHMVWHGCLDSHRNTVEDLKVAYCSQCEKYSLWFGEEMIFPASVPVELPNKDMPDEIKKDYDEAAKIVNVSARGAAALLRLAIQKLCKHLGEKGKDMNTDIANLVSKGLSQRIQQALDTVRVVGNESVHPGVLDLRDNKKLAFALFKLVNIITEKMISEEKQIDEIYNSLPEGKLKQINQRDGN